MESLQSVPTALLPKKCCAVFDSPSAATLYSGARMMHGSTLLSRNRGGFLLPSSIEW